MRAGPPRSILVVDDDEQVRHALRRTLRKYGHQAWLADGATQAFAELAARPIDIVIADHVMPTTTGIDFLSRVRDRYPKTLRVLLTGAADTALALRAINEGRVYRLLTKPWDDTVLQLMLNAAGAQLDLEREHALQLEQARRYRDRLIVQN